MSGNKRFDIYYTNQSKSTTSVQCEGYFLHMKKAIQLEVGSVKYSNDMGIVKNVNDQTVETKKLEQEVFNKRL